MKTTYLTKVMGLIMIGGCLTTYLFIDNYNQKKNDNNSAPKKITYEEVYGPALDEVHSLIAAEKTKNSGNSVFATNLEKALIDLKITKEIHQHVSKDTTQTMPAFPLLAIWGAISLLGFALLRSKDQKEKATKRSYEKMLDHLEMTYSQDPKKDKNNFEEDEMLIDIRSTSAEEF